MQFASRFIVIIRVFKQKMIIEKLDWMPWKPLENYNSWSKQEKEQSVGPIWLRRLLWCLILIGFLIHFGKYIIIYGF